MRAPIEARDRAGGGARPDIFDPALFVGHRPPPQPPCAAAAATKCRKIDKLENCAQVNRVKKRAPAADIILERGDAGGERPRDEHLPINLKASAALSGNDFPQIYGFLINLINKSAKREIYAYIAGMLLKLN